AVDWCLAATFGEVLPHAAARAHGGWRTRDAVSALARRRRAAALFRDLAGERLVHPRRVGVARRAGRRAQAGRRRHRATRGIRQALPARDGGELVAGPAAARRRILRG